MHQIIVQRVASNSSIPTTSQLKRWAKAVLQNKIPYAEVTIRIVDKDEITTLNAMYRHKNKATNVLSFPFDMPAEIDMDIPILGDIVICAEVIESEAREQSKAIMAHWAHMVVHGILHLLGYDHEKDQEAELMENEEIIILAKLGFNNPYEIAEKGE